MLYKQAHEIAIRCYKELEPFCEKIDIAGSVRREKPEPKDIEIVCQPRLTVIKDLFQQEVGKHRSYQFCNTVKSLGKILKGHPYEDRYVQIALPDGINLDLFMPIPEDYYRQLAIRTGSSMYSHKVLAIAWLNVGYCGTRNGLRLKSECYEKVIGQRPDGTQKKEWICNVENPTPPPIFTSEYDFFKFLKMEWVEPSKREI